MVKVFRYIKLRSAGADPRFSVLGRGKAADPGGGGVGNTILPNLPKSYGIEKIWPAIPADLLASQLMWITTTSCCFLFFFFLVKAIRNFISAVTTRKYILPCHNLSRSLGTEECESEKY